MDLKNKFFIMGLTLLVLISISVVSANENSTDLSSTDNIMDVEPFNFDNDIISVSDNNLDNSKLEVTNSVKTTITVGSVTAHPGDTYTLTANVKSDVGVSVPGNVVFRCGNEFSNALDSTGTAKINLKSQTPGIYKWSAYYGGGSKTVGSTTYNFLSSSTTFKVTIKGDALITANDVAAVYNSGDKYQVYVMDSYTNKGIANKPILISFYKDSKVVNIECYNTDENGICECIVNSEPGSYEVVASLWDEAYNSNDASFNLVVKKAQVSIFTSRITAKAYSPIILEAIVKDFQGNEIDGGSVKFTIGGKSYYADVVDGLATKTVKLEKGDYICNAVFSGNLYYSNSVSFKVIVNKASVKVTASKWISTTKSYATLKATVKDDYGNKVKEGTVKFTINGKSYSVKVKNGVATKNVKLTKAKNYDYKASFSSKNYQTKSASSKIYVKKAKKYYTFQVNKFKGKISYNKYMDLINAKNNGRYKSIHMVIGKSKGKYPIHMYIDTLHKDMQALKGDYIHVWIDDGRGMDGPTYVRKTNFNTLNP